jgi:hypothetical protein
MNKEQNAVLDEIRAEFPLFDDADLDQEKHHCEWSVQQDRKRLNALLDTLQARAQLAAPAGVVLSDEELWSIRNQVAIHEVLRDDDSVKICVKHGRAIEQAVLARINQHPASDVVQVPRPMLEDLRDCANECYNHARMRGTSGLDNYELLTEQADALLNGGWV